MAHLIRYYPNAKNKYVKHYVFDRPFIEPIGGGKFRVRQATEQGYAICDKGGVFDASYINSTIRRARVQEEGHICGCIMASGDTGYSIFIEHEI